MERSDVVHRLVPVAIKEANSKSVDGVENCVDILRYLKTLKLSHSKETSPLISLVHHENLTIRTEARLLFPDCNRAVALNPKKPSDVVCSASNKKKQSHDVAVVSKKRTIQKKKPDGCKSLAATSKPIQRKKQHQPVRVSETPKCSPALIKKNDPDTLELFQIAKKSADVANAKGMLLSKAVTSICLDTLSLLLTYPISSSAPETRKIMEKLSNLMKHKDRKICNAASELYYHWRKSIVRDLERGDV